MIIFQHLTFFLITFIIDSFDCSRIFYFPLSEFDSSDDQVRGSSSQIVQPENFRSDLTIC